jgi:hypothetical protein
MLNLQPIRPSVKIHFAIAKKGYAKAIESETTGLGACNNNL